MCILFIFLRTMMDTEYNSVVGEFQQQTAFSIKIPPLAMHSYQQWIMPACSVLTKNIHQQRQPSFSLDHITPCISMLMSTVWSLVTHDVNECHFFSMAELDETYTLSGAISARLWSVTRQKENKWCVIIAMVWSLLPYHPHLSRCCGSA